MSGEIRTYKIKHVKASLIGNLLENFIDMLPMKVETITVKPMRPLKLWVNTPANTLVIGIDPAGTKTTADEIRATWELIERLIAENDIAADHFHEV